MKIGNARSRVRLVETWARTTYFWPKYILIAALGFQMAGCHHDAPPEASTAPRIDQSAVMEARIPPDASPWEITTSDPEAPSHPYLGNGYLGFQTGIFGEATGARSHICLVAGNYREDTLSPLPHPFVLSVAHAGAVMSAGSISGYRQTLQLKDGLLITRVSLSSGGTRIPLTITTFASRSDPHLAVLHVSSPAELDLHSSLGSPVVAGEKTTSGGYYSPQVSGSPAVSMETASVRSPGKGTEWTAFTAVATSDDGLDPRKITASILRPLGAGSYPTALSGHTTAWHNLWRSDISIEGDKPAQQMVHAALFYLLESVRAGSRWSIPPMGLSSTMFAGHIYWDSEMWMFPVLALLHPAEARSLVDYRTRLLPQAVSLAAREKQKGASYPWESGRSGLEAASVGFAQERHVTADVAHMIWRYYQLMGDRTWLKNTGFPVLKATADYWIGRISHGPEGKAHILQVMGPDETAGIVDDDAFTNGVVKISLLEATLAAKEIGATPDPAWQDDAGKLVLPFDPREGHYLAHAGYHGETMKQADPELLIYPLGLVSDPVVVKKMLSYYPGRISPGGPAMTDAIYATVAARQGMAAEAARFFRRSYEPFLVAPFDQISEKHSHIRQYCFLTGLGGALQSVLYGFAGVEVGNTGLAAHPHLPASWKRLTITGLHFRGQTYKLLARTGEAGALVPEK